MLFRTRSLDDLLCALCVSSNESCSTELCGYYTRLGLHLNPGTTSDNKISARKITSGEPCTTSILTSCSHPISDHPVERTSTSQQTTRSFEVLQQKISLEPLRGGAPHFTWLYSCSLHTLPFDCKAQSLCSRPQFIVSSRYCHPLYKLHRDPLRGSSSNHGS